MEAAVLTDEPTGADTPEAPPQRELERRVADLCGLINAAHGELVGVIGEVVATDGWRGYGIRSVAHWVTLHCGVSAASAGRLVAVAEGLVDRPATKEALDRGELSVDQVVPICREIPAEFEASVAGFARSATVGQINRVCSGYVFSHPGPADGDGKDDAAGPDPQPDPQPQSRRRVGFGTGDDGVWRMAAVLSALEGAEVEKALLAARDGLFHTGVTGVSWADAMVEVCRAYLAGEPVTMADRYQIIVHARADDLDAARLHLGARLPDDVLPRLLCDSSIRALIDDDGHPVGLSPKTRTIPHWLRTLVEDRDATCRVPGCEHDRWLEIHHVVPVADDGDTAPDNLVALCGAHHAAHHRGDLHIAGDAHHLTITNRHGVTIGPRPPNPPTGPPLRAGPELGVTGTYQRPLGESLQTRWIHFAPAART